MRTKLTAAKSSLLFGALYSLVLLFVISRRITLVRHMSRENLESKCRVEKDARVKETYTANWTESFTTEGI
jgi:hypothetical protein